MTISISILKMTSQTRIFSLPLFLLLQIRIYFPTPNFLIHSSSSRILQIPFFSLTQIPAFSPSTFSSLDDNNNNNEFLSTISKIRIRDSCPSANSDPTTSLTLPMLDQFSVPDLKFIERKRLYNLFNVDKYTNLKDSEGDDVCPGATTFGSKIPVCDSGAWADANREAGGGYTLFHIRP